MNPDQPAENDSDGSQSVLTAVSLATAADCRALSDNRSGLAALASASRSPRSQTSSVMGKVSDSTTTVGSSGAGTPICWNSRSFSTITAWRNWSRSISALPSATSA